MFSSDNGQNSDLELSEYGSILKDNSSQDCKNFVQIISDKTSKGIVYCFDLSGCR